MSDALIFPPVKRAVVVLPSSFVMVILLPYKVIPSALTSKPAFFRLPFICSVTSNFMSLAVEVISECKVSTSVSSLVLTLVMPSSAAPIRVVNPSIETLNCLLVRVNSPVYLATFTWNGS